MRARPCNIPPLRVHRTTSGFLGVPQGTHLFRTTFTTEVPPSALYLYLYFIFLRDPAKAFNYSNLLVSGRFRKVSGSLSGSLHVNFSFVAVPEGSGRFPEGCPEACLVFVCVAAVPEASGRLPEACPEACQTASISCIPEASGRFPEVVPEGYKTPNMSLGPVSQTSLRAALLILKSIWLANQVGSFSCHARKQVKFPEAFRKVAGSFPEAYK